MTRFEAAIQQFDAANSADPNTEVVDGKVWPRELLYARRLTNWVKQLEPAASEPLLLAARAQHLRRWEIPRETYPQTKAGYLKWRSDLKKFHAEEAGKILRNCGYDEALIGEVQALNLKSDFPNSPESRVLEDALCLIFLEYQFAELAGKASGEKVINAVQKSWKKMTERARAEALKLRYDAKCEALLEKALRPAP